MLSFTQNKLVWFFSMLCYKSIGIYLPHTFWPGGFVFSWFRRVMLIGMGCHIGNKCELEPGIDVGFKPNIIIGQQCQINKNVQMMNANIGNFVMIAPGCVLLDRMHNISDVNQPMIFQGQSEKNPPIIGDDVWIGQNVIVMPGITIGKGAIVGADKELNRINLLMLVTL